MSDTGVQIKGLQVLDRQVYPAGEKIFREGDAGSRAYIVQSGSVDIVKEIEGVDVVVANVGPGSIFGEMALIDDEPRMASAIVSDPCVCIVITSSLFQKKMNNLDPFLGGVLRILVENIRSIQEAKQEANGLGGMFDCVDCVDDDGIAALENEIEEEPEIVEEEEEKEDSFEIA